MKIKKYFIILSFIILSGCSSKFMDLAPLDSPSSATFYSNQDEMVMALNGCYTSLSKFDWDGIPYQWFLDCTTDIAWYRGGGDFPAAGAGLQSASTGEFFNIWKTSYTCIGRCTRLLEGMVKGKDKVAPATYNQIAAEARFLRAYCYLQLVPLFGDIPLVDKTLPIDQMKVARTPKADIYKFIYAELDAAAKDLPLTAADNGHAAKGVALATKARAALYNGDYSISAEAAKAVIDLKQYTLHPNYRELFTYAGDKANEIMFSYGFATGTRVHGICRTLTARMNRGMFGGYTTIIPTMKLVDSYECIDGKPINESPIYDPKKPYINRDPRLHQTIICPGDLSGGWIFQSHPDSIRTKNVETGEIRGNLDATGAFASFSGFTFLKFFDEKDLPASGLCTMNLILLRYAEVLLTYAEAKIELGQIDQSVYDAINLVRSRTTVKMPNVTSVTAPNQAAMRTQIRRERNVELAQEGLRIFDIRRWKLAETALNVTLYGRPNAKTRKYEGLPAFDATGEVPNYDAYKDIFRVIEVRKFNKDRDYLWPIPQNEINANSSLTQNPGY